MRDSNGKAVKEAYPGTAVTVTGWKTLPSAGDEILDGSEADVKKAIANRERRAQMEASLADVEVINQTRRLERERREQELAQSRENSNNGSQVTESQPPTETGPKQLRLIIKADVSGSAEAVAGALQGIGNKEAVTSIISTGVGEVTESDVTMAKAVGGMTISLSPPQTQI
jgi:translation initiation factor IF-2